MAFLQSCSPFPRVACLAATLGAGGCADNLNEAHVTPPPTLVSVRPQDFLGDVPCLDAPGAMRRYVATVFDVSGGLFGDGGLDGDFELPSSGPVPCDTAVTFGFVVPTHEYVAEVQGFDRTDLSPLGGAQSGSAIMVDREGAPVPARWTTSCGRAPATEGGGPAPDAGRTTPKGTHPARSEQHVTVPVRGCAPLVDHVGPAPTSIRLDIADALGQLECGSSAGMVSSFEARRVGSADEPTAAACAGEVEFVGLTAGRSYEFAVLAFEEDGAVPTWGTTCRQVALAGVSRKAGCDLLSTRGSLTIDIASLLAVVDVPCGKDGFPHARVELGPVAEGPALVRDPVACNDVALFSNLAAGLPYEATVTTTLAGGAPGPSAHCEAVVLPGPPTAPQCTVAPAG